MIADNTAKQAARDKDDAKNEKYEGVMAANSIYKTMKDDLFGVRPCRKYDETGGWHD